MTITIRRINMSKQAITSKGLIIRTPPKATTYNGPVIRTNKPTQTKILKGPVIRTNTHQQAVTYKKLLIPKNDILKQAKKCINILKDCGVKWQVEYTEDKTKNSLEDHLIHEAIVFLAVLGLNK